MRPQTAGGPFRRSIAALHFALCIAALALMAACALSNPAANPWVRFRIWCTWPELGEMKTVADVKGSFVLRASDLLFSDGLTPSPKLTSAQLREVDRTFAKRIDAVLSFVATHPQYSGSRGAPSRFASVKFVRSGSRMLSCNAILPDNVPPASNWTPGSPAVGIDVRESEVARSQVCQSLLTMVRGGGLWRKPPPCSANATLLRIGVGSGVNIVELQRDERRHLDDRCGRVPIGGIARGDDEEKRGRPVGRRDSPLCEWDSGDQERANWGSRATPCCRGSFASDVSDEARGARLS